MVIRWITNRRLLELPMQLLKVIFLIHTIGYTSASDFSSGFWDDFCLCIHNMNIFNMLNRLCSNSTLRSTAVSNIGTDVVARKNTMLHFRGLFALREMNKLVFNS